MSGSVWTNCCVCSAKFNEKDGDRAHFFRCITCSDLQSSIATKDDLKTKKSLHVCNSCHQNASFFHCSTHCWAKCYTQPFKFREDEIWIDKLRTTVSSLANSEENSSGLNSILGEEHHVECSSCLAGIFGSRYISALDLSNHCGACVCQFQKSHPEHNVWLIRSSIFINTPHNGPFRPPPEKGVIDSTEDPKSKTLSKPKPPSAGPVPRLVSGNFGLRAIPVSKPGENYSDYVDNESEETKSFVDSNVEEYEEAQAVNLKKGSSYYDDDDDNNASQPFSKVGSSGYSDDTSAPQPFSNVGSSGYSDDNSVSQSFSNVGSSGYSDDTSAPQPFSNVGSSGYADDNHAPQPFSNVGSSGYTDDNHAPQPFSNVGSSGYTEDNASPFTQVGTKGYTDESDIRSSAGYSDPTSVPFMQVQSSGYDDVSSGPTLANFSQFGTTGYEDDSSPQTKPVTSKDHKSFAIVETPTPKKEIDPYADADEDDETDGYGDNEYYKDSSNSQTSVDHPKKSNYSQLDVDPYSDEPPKNASTDPYGSDEEDDPYGSNETKTKKPASTQTSNNDPFLSAEVHSGYASIQELKTSTSVMGYEEVHSTTQNTSYGYSSVEDTSQQINTLVSTPTPKSNIAPTTGSRDTKNRDWNEEFQICVSKFKHAMAKETPDNTELLAACGELYALSDSFIEIAQQVGRTIIEEVSIPAPAKTIKPVNVGGVAGGEKYVMHGIFFKFAIDAFGVYGGDEYAQKAAGHELAGLKAYYNCKIEGLNTPFMLLMDYRGYRLIATTKLPIGGNSLIYGSADGGITIHKDDRTFNDMMERAAQMLNIKPHVVGMRNQHEVLFAPTDIEGHKGLDGRYYVLDTARICPPEPIHKSFSAVIVPPEDRYGIPNNGFFQSSSTEKEIFWKPYPALKEVGLTTDRWVEQINAYLGVTTSTSIVSSEEFGEGLLYHLKLSTSSVLDNPAQNSTTLNVRASNLVKKLIYGPALLVLRGRKGAQLFNLLRYELIKSSSKPLSSDSYTPFGKHNREIHNEEIDDTYYKLVGEVIPNWIKSGHYYPHALGALQSLQAAGINTRFLGFLRSHIGPEVVSARTLKTWFLNEMIVRVTKNYIRSKLRKATSKLKPIEPIIIRRMNLLLGSSLASTFFWTTEVKAQLVNKFGRNGQALTADELASDWDLRKSINMISLFQYIQVRMGIIFTPSCNARIQLDDKALSVPDPLFLADLERIEVKQKSLLQPDLDSLLIRTASKMHNNDPMKMLETLGKYLPKAETHPSVALNRLTFVESLLNKINDQLGQTLYPSNMDLICDLNSQLGLHIDYNNLTPTQISSGVYGTQRELLKIFLNNTPEYQEVLSQMKVLMAWIKEIPECPLEITVKFTYLQGFLSIIHRNWDEAETFLRVSYDILCRVTKVPPMAGLESVFSEPILRKVPFDTDRLFSMMILDKLVHVMVALDRKDEAVAYSQIWVAYFISSSFPGNHEDMKIIFGEELPIAFSLIEPYVSSYTFGFLEISKKLNNSLMSSTRGKPEEILKYKDRVILGNFNELSGYFISPAIIKEFIASQTWKSKHLLPVVLSDYKMAWRKIISHGEPQQTTIIPPFMSAGKNVEITCSYYVHENRLEFGDKPFTVILVKDLSYSQFLANSDKLFTIPPENIVGRIPFEDPNASQYQISKKNYTKVKVYGVVTFKIEDLTPGAYMALLVDGKDHTIGGQKYAAAQVMNVLDNKTRQFSVVCDHFSGWWEEFRLPTSNQVKSISMCDSYQDTFGGPNFPTNIFVVDTAGKVWESKNYNYARQPPLLCINTHEEFVEPSISLVKELIAWKVVQVSVSKTHTLILTDTNEVLAYGTNKHGALGNGDTVELQDPRLIRKLKGKPITRVWAGPNRSCAIDKHGNLYQWGIDYTALPELHPFFNGTSPESKGVKRTIRDVIFSNASFDTRHSRNEDFFCSNPIAYIDTNFHAFLSCSPIINTGNTIIIEQVLSPNAPILQVAIAETAIAFLTTSGEVYTNGPNDGGALGVPFKSTVHGAAKNTYRSSIPYSGARRVSRLNNVKIIKLLAGGPTFWALSNMADVYTWGGGQYFVPTIPPPCNGLRISDIFTSGRGFIANVDMNLSLPLAPIDSDISTLPSMTPIVNEIDGTMFKVEKIELDPKPDFKLSLSVPKLLVGYTFYVRFVTPEKLIYEQYANSYPFHIPSNLYQCDLMVSFSKSLFGTGMKNNNSDQITFQEMTPYLSSGEFQIIIYMTTEQVSTKDDDLQPLDSYQSHTENDMVIFHRSQTFKIDFGHKPKMVLEPTMPGVKEVCKFTVSPVKPGGNVGEFIIIRKKDDNVMYGCILVTASELEHTNYLPGIYQAQWVRTSDVQLPPEEVFATLDFEVGLPLEKRPVLELEFTPADTIVKSSLVLVNWKFTKNTPSGTTYGGWYNAEQKGISAAMQGGYLSMVGSSGNSTITGPTIAGKYEFRINTVSPDTGMSVIKSIPFDVVDELKIEEHIEDKSPTTTETITPTESPENSLQSQILSQALDSLNDFNSDIAQPVINTPSKTSSSSTSSPVDWNSFFTLCKIDKLSVITYTKIMEMNSIDFTSVLFLDSGLLSVCQITNVKHILAIMQQVHKMRQDKLIELIDSRINVALNSKI